MSIVTVTMNPAVDLTCRVDRVVPGEKLRARDLRREPGGGGLNVSRVIARLGGESIAVYPAGGDAGRLLEQLLRREGVGSDPVPVEGITRENIAVGEDASEEHYRFVMPGAPMSPEECKRCLERIEEIEPAPSYVVASGSLPPGVSPDFYAHLAETVTDRGGRFVLDTSGDPLVRAVRHGVFLLKPNVAEIAQLHDEPVGPGDHEAAARRLASSGAAEVVVLSLGAGGAFLATKDHTRHLRSPTVPINSKVGAGDSMVGAMVLALAQGRSVDDAATYGVAAGAAAVMTGGSELCRGEDVERLYRRIVQEDQEEAGAPR